MEVGGRLGCQGEVGGEGEIYRRQVGGGCRHENGVGGKGQGWRQATESFGNTRAAGVGVKRFGGEEEGIEGEREGCDTYA